MREALRFGSVTALLLAMGGGAHAAAKPGESGRTPVIQALSDCRAIVQNDARLQCYDKAADAFDQAQATGQVIVVDREQVRAVKRQAFGFALPSIDLFGRGPKEGPMDDIVVELSNAREGPDGNWELATTDGAVWKQTDQAGMYGDPRAGAKMLIKRGMLGSFFCKVGGRAAVRCMRIR